MSLQEKQLTEKESLDLITQMISKAKNSYYDTGLSAMLWGAVIAICSLEKLTELQFNYRLPFDIYLLTFAAIIPQVLIDIRERKERKVISYDDTYMRYIWLSFGIAIFLMILITNNIYAHLTPLIEASSQRIDWTDFSFSEYVSSFFLLLYGLPTFITGAACRVKLMLWGGLFCWACCVAAIYTPIKIDLFLTALSAVFAWFIPGIQMQRDYKKAKRGLAQANV